MFAVDNTLVKNAESGMGGVKPLSVDVITLAGGIDGSVNGVIFGTEKLILVSEVHVDKLLFHHLTPQSAIDDAT